ncbi:TetR/AcrR family transcriptional regulator [Roseomonas elaeocarpi]|uniref:TetR/AcrR family transcriptional regulator n=1 Tax=Roseomonas elaeocarpi TaxID=907779 RepID=A0ABV6JNU1_9PROT
MDAIAPLSVLAPPPPAQEDMEALRERVLRCAETCFVHQGFHVTTMDAIARDARCSKKTIYKLFSSKGELFNALLTRFRLEIGQLRVDPDWEPGHAIRYFLEAMADILLRDRSVALVRIAMSEAGRMEMSNPALNSSASAIARSGLEDYLAELQRRGSHDVGEPIEATRMLIGMALGAFHHELLTGLKAEVPRQELLARIEQAVRIFLRGTQCVGAAA